MRTLEVLSGEKRRRIAKETLEIYAPIANRLGMHAIRIEFEDLGFKAMHPMRSARIYQAVKRARGNRKEIVNKIEESLSHCLAIDGIQGEVSGRQKHLYGIYKKMRGKRRAFNEIMDVYAFRIIVDKVDTCYRVLGAVHNLYKPLPGRFKDYIAIPKANGYQSLHTTLFGMHGVPIEIQIRTREMEEMANNGIAAHWLYKSSGDEQPKGTHARARQWVKGVLEMQQRAGNSLEFIESVKIDLFRTRSTCSRPKAGSWSCPRAPRRSTSLTRCTPTWATAALPVGSIVVSHRCPSRYKVAPRSRSSALRARGRTRHGSISWSPARRGRTSAMR
jgi:RelA/SpoT family (p)ppGpp synthetase